MVFRADLYRREIADVKTAVHHHVADILGCVRFLIGDDEILAIILRHPPNRLDGDRSADAVREIGVGQAMRGEPGGVSDDFDFPYI